jgi:peptidoglycan L-alanyl-D-glutamate endopeptidase CwlK
MLDTISKSRLDLVHPELSRRIHTLDSHLEVDGIHIRVVRGLATWSAQDAIYQQGRTTPGPIVTHARPEHSAHCFLYAVDAAPDDTKFPSWHPDWNELDDRWKDLLAKAKDCGLSEGADWRSVNPDYPHLYLKELPATPDAELVNAMHEGGLDAVRTIIDKRLGTL